MRTSHPCPCSHTLTPNREVIAGATLASGILPQASEQPLCHAVQCEGCPHLSARTQSLPGSLHGKHARSCRSEGGGQMLMDWVHACRGPRSMAATHGMRTMEQNGHAPGHGSAREQLSQVGHHVLGSSQLQGARPAEAGHRCHIHGVLHLKAGPHQNAYYRNRVPRLENIRKAHEGSHSQENLQGRHARFQRSPKAMQCCCEVHGRQIASARKRFVHMQGPEPGRE